MKTSSAPAFLFMAIGSVALISCGTARAPILAATDTSPDASDAAVEASSEAGVAESSSDTMGQDGPGVGLERDSAVDEPVTPNEAAKAEVPDVSIACLGDEQPFMQGAEVCETLPAAKTPCSEAMTRPLAYNVCQSLVPEMRSEAAASFVDCLRQDDGSCNSIVAYVCALRVSQNACLVDSSGAYDGAPYTCDDVALSCNGPIQPGSGDYLAPEECRALLSPFKAEARKAILECYATRPPPEGRCRDWFGVCAYHDAWLWGR